MVDPNRMMELQQDLLNLRVIDWYDKVISFQWFFLVLLLIIPWIIWWRFVDKKRIIEIFALGLLLSAISSVFNGNGLNLMLWSYPYKLLPYSPRAYSFSLSAIPVAFMFLYQFFPRWRAYSTATVILAAVTAFIIQPIFSLFDMYKLIKWNYFYSFMTLIFIGLFARLIHQLVLKRQHDPESLEEASNQSGMPAPAHNNLHKQH